MNKFIIIVLFTFGFLSCKNETKTIKTQFLTEDIPDATPIAFKQPIIPKNKLIHKGIFSPDLKAYYYTISDKNFENFEVFVINKSNGKWSEPEHAFFNSKYDEHGMSFSPNGNTLYFSSTRPVDIDGVAPTWHIWQSDKVNGKWTAPMYVDIPNLRNKLVSHPTLTNSDILFFHTSNLDYSDMDIFHSIQVNGMFEDAKKTSIRMDSITRKCTPYVSPNGDYLIFASIGNELDLMISFNDGNGGWKNTKKLNPKINTLGQGNPYVTPDNKFLFYTTGEHIKKNWSVNWVNIESELKNNSVTTKSKDTGITCNTKGCEGAYEGPEFIEGSDIAHQFSNTMSAAVGKKSKTLYLSGLYSKVNFSEIKMSTKGMGSGHVNYTLSIPFIAVNTACEAYTSFDHVGGWNHTPALLERKEQLSNVLMEGHQLDISDLNTTPEGLQEHWIQWKHKTTQSECD